MMTYDFLCVTDAWRDPSKYIVYIWIPSYMEYVFKLVLCTTAILMNHTIS